MYLAGRELLLARAHIGGQIQISAEHLLARQSFLGLRGFVWVSPDGKTV